MKSSEIENFLMWDRKFHKIVKEYLGKQPSYQNLATDEEKAVFIFSYIKKSVDKITKIVTHPKIIDDVKSFHYYQQDIPRYVKMAKRLGNIPIDSRKFRESQDPDLIGNPRDIDDTTAEGVMKDDARAFYYELDVMTGGKYKFLEKINKALENTNFIYGLERSCACSYMDNDKMVFEIDVDTRPIAMNRTVLMHELWHGIDEKNFNQSEDVPKEQFVGEIGSMFIDKLSLDYLEKNHSDDKYVINALKDSNSNDDNLLINKARDSYLDSLICRIVDGSPDSGKRALIELVDNIGYTWSLGTLTNKCNELLKVINTPESHYGPFYEFRYIIGEVVADKVYNSNLSMSEKVSKIADINNHILSIDKLNTSGAKNYMDIVTNYLGIPKIEECVEEMATKYEMSKNSTNFRQQNNQPNNDELYKFLVRER